MRRILLAVALFFLLAFLGMTAYIDAYGQIERARPAPVIVVLGASVTEQGVPGDSLRARTLHAVELYRRGFAHKILCTGGIGKYPPAEARAAADLARRKGVPASDLVLEDRSTNTEENARNTAQICRAHGWDRVIAVSDPYHLWRVQRDFRQVGLACYPSPALNCRRNRHWGLRFLWTARETLAVLRDCLWPNPR